ncbi:MAG: YtxH domain-containing protein [Armatimonadetes bacterium]|nr:YtxH domain-containing protein [Armatimonadota bacterium]
MEVDKMSNNEEPSNNNMLYLLAGVGIGAIIGAAAGLLFAPKAGSETRAELGDKLKEFKGKTEEWVNEQRTKRASKKALDEEVGA